MWQYAVGRRVLKTIPSVCIFYQRMSLEQAVVGCYTFKAEGIHFQTNWIRMCQFG